MSELKKLALAERELVAKCLAAAGVEHIADVVRPTALGGEWLPQAHIETSAVRVAVDTLARAGLLHGVVLLVTHGGASTVQLQPVDAAGKILRLIDELRRRLEAVGFIAGFDQVGDGPLAIAVNIGAVVFPFELVVVRKDRFVFDSVEAAADAFFEKIFVPALAVCLRRTSVKVGGPA
jgi:hypothetical protein